jgi:ABC-type polysaccharide/polyol phosphate export permease
MIARTQDLFRSRDLFVTLVERQIRMRAKRSWLSTVWPVIAPFLLMALYVFVFKRVFNVPIDDYPVYLLAGLLPWVFLAQTLPKAASSISPESDLLRKAPFPYELLPLSMVAAQAYYIILTTSIFVAYLGFSGRLVFSALPFLIFPLLAIFLLVSGLSMILALIDVYSHDLRAILGQVLTMWFLLVPILYRPNMVPKAIEQFQTYEPVGLVVGQFRAVLYRGTIDEPFKLVLMLVSCAAVFLISHAVFTRFTVDLAKDV